MTIAPRRAPPPAPPRNNGEGRTERLTDEILFGAA
jgi:hypothetical protein